MNDFFDNRRILEIFWSRRYHIVAIGVIAIVLASVFSSPFFIQPKFKAQARLYPVNVVVMSEESKSEQMLEMINSNDLKLRLFETFGLHEVYGIDPGDPLYMTYMLGEFNKNFAARKTEFETVQIEILDTDPLRAAAMVDSMIHFYNQKVRILHANKNLEMVVILEENLRRRRHERDSVASELAAFRKNYQIMDAVVQAPEVTRGYMNLLSQGRSGSADFRKVEEIYSNLVHKGVEAQVIESHFNYLNQHIDSLLNMYHINRSEARKIISYSHVVEHPIVPDKKAYPVRWLIVMVSFLSALFFSLLLFVAIDYSKKQ